MKAEAGDSNLKNEVRIFFVINLFLVNQIKSNLIRKF
jgi:hypothetical protein